MKTAEKTLYSSFKKPVALTLLCFSFLTACTPATRTTGQTQRQSTRSNTTFARSNGATITPLSNKLKQAPASFSSFNGGMLTVEYDTGNLWDKIPNDFQLEDASDNPAVQSHIHWFLNHRQYLDRTSKRAAPYIYYIYEQVQQRQLPMELVLLPINESAYNPFATSSQSAGGIWQMIRGTASQYGVKQNWWYDGRRDIYASTKAALDHLTYLHNFFNGDWLLAIAAYNCGEGTVQRAIQRNAIQGKPTDFWSLSLPEETRAYVPRLLALAIILRDRQGYNLELPPIEDQPYLTQVDIDTPISLADAAQLANLDLSELKKLNPAHKYSSKVLGNSFKLVLPINRVDIFKQNLTTYQPHGDRHFSDFDDEEPTRFAVSSHPRISQRIATSQGQAITRLVKRGDNLATIAKLYKVSSKDIIRWNRLGSTHLKPGTKLVVGYIGDNNIASSHTSATHENKKNITRLAKNTASNKTTYYTVRRGDSLARIAKRKHVSIASLLAWNDIAHHDVKPGQQLVIHRG